MTEMAFGRLGYSEEQIELLNVATEYCRDKSPVDAVRALLGEDRGYDPALWQEIATLGWLGIAISEEHGGSGLSLAEAVPVMEQMGRNLLASPFLTTSVVAHVLGAAGNDEQQATWLPRLAEGAVATLALTEALGGWDLFAATASAVSDNAGRVQVSGTKRFVLWADSAELLLVSVRHEGRIRLALVEASALGEGALRRETVVDETKRSYEVTLKNVPALGLLPLETTDQAFAALENAANLLQSAEMVGGCQAVIDYTLDYLRTRKQFGRIIGEYQALKHPMVDAYVHYEKARSHLYAAAYSFADQGQGEVAVRMAKAAADRAYSFASDRAIQFHGGFGFTAECDAGLYRRNAIWNASQFGDAAWQRAKLAELIF